MDLPKKRSSRYLSVVYVFFIVLFIFTLILFYISRCQKSSRPIQKERDPAQSEGIVKKQPRVTKKDTPVSPQNNIIDSGKSPGQAPVPSPSPVQRPSSAGTADEKGIIYFSTDSTGLTDQALEKLKAIYLFLLKYPDEVITIKGYGDSGPNQRHNQKLSQLRANIVKSYFVKRGISDARLNVSWLDPENAPVGDASQEDGGKTHQVEVQFNMKSKGSRTD